MKQTAKRVYVEPLTPEKLKLRRRGARLRLISSLLVILAIMILVSPFTSQFYYANRQMEVAEIAEDKIAAWRQEQRDMMRASAIAYNERLAAYDKLIMDLATSHTDDPSYIAELAEPDGVMATLEIPSISLKLPVYHGTDETVISNGVGHIYGTSLPVGGPSTHAVMTSHRGLAHTLLFTRLDELKVGDPFYINVLGETLGYQVIDVTVIDPFDAAALEHFKIVPGADLVTLMTCTPYGINTHRLLIRAQRADIPDEVPEPDDAPVDWWLLSWIIGGAAAILYVTGTTLYRWLQRRAEYKAMVAAAEQI
jgi:sortase A